MSRIVGALIVACILSFGLAFAQSGAGGTVAPAVHQVTVHLFSPWLGEEEVTIAVPSETDARLKVEELLRQGYWQVPSGAQPTIVWPPASIVSIRVIQVF